MNSLIVENVITMILCIVLIGVLAHYDSSWGWAFLLLFNLNSASSINRESNDE